MSLLNSAQLWLTGVKIRASAFTPLAAKKRVAASLLAASVSGVDPSQPEIDGNCIVTPIVMESRICIYFPRNDPDALPPAISSAATKLRAENEAKFLVRTLSCAFDRAAVREIDGQSHAAKLKAIQTAPPSLTNTAMSLEAEQTVASEDQPSTRSEQGRHGTEPHPTAATRTRTATANVQRTRPPRISLRQRVLEYRRQQKRLQAPLHDYCIANLALVQSMPTLWLQQDLRLQERLREQREEVGGENQTSDSPRTAPAQTDRPRAHTAGPRLDVGARYLDYTQSARYQERRQWSLERRRQLEATQRVPRPKQVALRPKARQSNPRIAETSSHESLPPPLPRCRVPLRIRVTLRQLLGEESPHENQLGVAALLAHCIGPTPVHDAGYPSS
jgi:hypothetical protein